MGGKANSKGRNGGGTERSLEAQTRPLERSGTAFTPPQKSKHNHATDQYPRGPRGERRNPRGLQAEPGQIQRHITPTRQSDTSERESAKTAGNGTKKVSVVRREGSIHIVASAEAGMEARRTPATPTRGEDLTARTDFGGRGSAAETETCCRATDSSRCCSIERDPQSAARSSRNPVEREPTIR